MRTFAVAMAFVLAGAAIHGTACPAAASLVGTEYEGCQDDQQGQLEERQQELEQPDLRQQELEQPDPGLIDTPGTPEQDIEEPDSRQQDLERPRYEYEF